MTEPLRELVSGIDTIWNLTTGRIPDKDEPFIVREDEWNHDDPTHAVRTIRKVEILA